mgnify:CR=1 FL=1|jgi:hypothetical protein
MSDATRSIGGETDSALERAWEAVDRDWSDVEAHRRLLALAREFDALPLVAGRYREAVRVAPERAEVAAAQQGRIVALALARFAEQATPRSKAPERIQWVLRVIAFAFLLTSVAAFVHSMIR